MVQPTTSRAASQTIAANVRAELARLRKSGRTAAADLNYPSTTFARRLSGETPFSTDELVAVADYLGVDLTVLLPQQAAAS